MLLIKDAEKQTDAFIRCIPSLMEIFSKTLYSESTGGGGGEKGPTQIVG